MKRIWLIMLAAMFCLSVFSGCGYGMKDDTPSDIPYYKVIFNDKRFFAPDYVPQESYRAGEEVLIKLATVTEQYYRLYVNGEEVPMYDADLYDTWFSFRMPDSDVIVDIEVVSVDIPSFL